MLLPNKQKCYNNIKLKEAEAILYRYGRLYDEVYYQDSGACINFKELLDFFPMKTLARDVGPLTFTAGPPTKISWYDGSLLTFVLDCILWSEVIKNESNL